MTVTESITLKCYKTLSLILSINLNFLTKYLCLIKLHSDQFCY